LCFPKWAPFNELGVDLTGLFDKRVRYVQKVKSYWPRISKKRKRVKLPHRLYNMTGMSADIE